jgi:hypothetical protein
MSRLIDADWVLSHLKPYAPSDEEWSITGGTALRLIHNAVDNVPTIDAEPVTRCRNCYNAITIDCVLYCTHWRMNTFDDGYCHEGF